MSLFTQPNALDSNELANAKTTPTKNHLNNGALTPIATQPFSPHSYLKETLFALVEPPVRPHIEAGDAACLAFMTDFPGVCLNGADDMLFGIYQDWVQQNPENHMDGGITEDGKCQSR